MDNVPIVCLFQCLCVPMCMYPPLIQPLSPCRLDVSSLTLKSSQNLFVCLCGLPRCPHNVRQSIIIWPTYLPCLATALVIHPLASTVSISDLPLPLKNPLIPVLRILTNNACLAPPPPPPQYGQYTPALASKIDYEKVEDRWREA